MTKTKSMKRAWIMSVLSLVICISMLVGSTFAWFTDTDTVTTSNIVAGTLDLEIIDGAGLEKTTPLAFVNADGSADILWEPNATFRTEPFRLKNMGSLWLKCKLVINNTEVSYNKLNEVIKFKLVRADGSEVTIADLVLAPGADNNEWLYIEGHMDEKASNEYQGLILSGLSITVYATQYTSEKDMTDENYDQNALYDDKITTVSTADEFVHAFAKLENGGIVALTGDIDMTGKAWTPVDNKSYTLNGNGFTVTGLNGGMTDHTGSSSITIKNVTFDSLVDNSNTNYAGLIADADTCSYLNLNNVTVQYAEISSNKYAAGFVAYTSGYGNDYDGPVNAVHNFTNCTLLTASVQGGGSVGALIGHAGGNTATTTTINGMTVACSAIVGEDAAHTGVILGTSHVGEVILNYDETAVQAGSIVGRFVPGTTGKLLVNGVEQVAFASEEMVPAVTIIKDSAALAEAVADAQGATTVTLSKGTYSLSSSLANKEITFAGTKDVVIDTTTSTASTNGAAITFEGVSVQFNDTANYKGFSHTKKVVYQDCTIIGQQTLYAPEAEFINCTFENMSGYNVWTYGATDVTFTDCIFKTGGRAILVYNEVTADNFVANVTVKNCTFDDNGTYKDPKAAVETGSNGGNTETSNRYNLTFSGCTINGFEANNSTSPLWGNKNSLDQNHLNVIIDGVDQY